MSLGTDRMQLDPAHPWPAVDTVKQIAAEFIDVCNRRRQMWSSPSSDAGLGAEQARLLELAMTDIENAVMWFVKAEILGSYGPGIAFRP